MQSVNLSKLHHATFTTSAFTFLSVYVVGLLVTILLLDILSQDFCLLHPPSNLIYIIAAIHHVRYIMAKEFIRGIMAIVGLIPFLIIIPLCSVNS